MGLISFSVYQMTRNVEDLFDNIKDYFYKKELKKLLDEGYRYYYVCNVSNIQSSKSIFLSEFDEALLMWKHNHEFFRIHRLSDYIMTNRAVKIAEMEPPLQNENFWLVADEDEEIISELCIESKIRSYLCPSKEFFVDTIRKANEKVSSRAHLYSQKNSDIFRELDKVFSEEYISHDLQRLDRFNMR